MAGIKLPPLSEKRAEYNNFPTLFQNFIFRNWESVTTEKMAQILGTDKSTIEALASEMGLRVPAKYNKNYKDRGFLTVVRNNWHLLPYEQILKLCELPEDELAFTLREDDFFDIKLGSVKPDVPKLSYRPLTDEEKEKTKKIRENLLGKLPDFGKETGAEDFDFLYKFSKNGNNDFCGEKREVVLDKTWGLCDNSGGKYTENFLAFAKEKGKIDFNGNEKFITVDIVKDKTKKAESHSIFVSKNGIKITSVDEVGVLRAFEYLEKLIKLNNSFSFDEMNVVRDTRFDIRYIYSYCALFGDPFMDGGLSSYPDSLLKEYSRIGVNGIWMHSVLYKMCEIPWNKELSEGWQKRLSGLKQICDRAEKYGIKVYMYINEPRAMDKAMFEKYPDILGHYTDNGLGTLCTSTKEVQDYLYNGIKTVCEAAPNLGGFFTITASENITNCYSHFGAGLCPCERCKKRLPEEVFAEVNGIIKKAAMSVNPDIEVIAYTWAWHHCSDPLKTVELCAKNGVRVLSVSEEGVEKDFDGTKTSVIDYSISLVGPGEKSKRVWKTAKEYGGKTLAKVQFNNSWEGSTIPYIPVLDLVKAHMDGICKNDVDGLMLSWSLGGYPSMNLEAMSKYFFGEENEGDVYLEMFGKNADVIRRATSDFSRAFSELPFHVHTAYLGNFQMGTANLMFEKNSGLSATMTGFPYDDVKSWCAIFPVDVYENQMKKLSEIWKEGLVKLVSCVDIDCENTKEFVEIATAGYCIYRSCYLQTRYNLLRDEYNAGKKELRSEILSILDEEEELAVKMYDVAANNSTIGFEAANHYFFNKYSLAEKIVNIGHLKEYFRS